MLEESRAERKKRKLYINKLGTFYEIKLVMALSYTGQLHDQVIITNISCSEHKANIEKVS